LKKIIYIPVLVLFVNNLFARTIRIGKQQIVKTIQQGLILAVHGDSVLVEPGHYHEKNIIINKTIFLIGINHPVLDGDKKYEIIYIKANGEVVEGFKVIDSVVSSIVD